MLTGPNLELERAVGHTRVMLRNLRDGVITWQADGTLSLYGQN